MNAVQRAVTALQLLAVDPLLKSVCFSGPIGSGKSQLLSLYEQLVDSPKIVVPTHVTADRLYGGISLDETLQQQKVVYEEGLFEREQRGYFLVEHLDRFEPTMARTVVKAVEEQFVQFTRETVVEKKLQHTAIYTMQEAFDQVADALLDCIGLSVTLQAPEAQRRVAVLKNEPIAGFAALQQQVERAKTILPFVTLEDEMLLFMEELLAAYEVYSVRAYYAFIHAAKAYAALQGEQSVTLRHIHEVASYVLNHRTDAQPPETAEQPPSSPENPAQTPEREQHEGEDVLVEVEAKEQGALSLEVPQMTQMKKMRSGKAVQLQAEQKRGRQIGTAPYKKAAPDVDFLATLKKAIPEQPLYERGETMITVKPHHFVNKKRQQKQAQHFIFVVDASQSMHQNEQMTAVKGVVLSLLKDAYQKRNVISFISMYQEKSEIQLQASKNISLARQTLQQLKVGGKTPLASGLQLSQQILQTSDIPVEATKVIVITDGRANITLAGEKHVKQALQESLEQAEQLRNIGVQALIVDTEQGAVKLEKAQQLAKKMQGHYIKFSDFSKLSTYQFIRNGG